LALKEKVKGFSLWLMPEGGVCVPLQKTIEDLAARLKSPIFEPHITLIGQIAGRKDEVLAKSAALAGLMTACEISSDGLDFRDSYFQALFVKIKETPPVMGASRTACRIFKGEPSSPYMPHLSLAYGDLDVREKERIMAEISADIDFTFIADKIHLYATEGEPEGWCLLKSFPLKNPSIK